MKLLLPFLFLLISSLSAGDFETGMILYGEGKYSEAIASIEKAAVKGEAEAQYCLGLLFFEDTDEVAQDNEKALKWFKKAADQEHPGAQYKMGYIYWGNNGVPQDEMESLKWFRKAAKNGHKEAQEIIKKVDGVTSEDKTVSSSSEHVKIFSFEPGDNISYTTSNPEGIKGDDNMSVKVLLHYTDDSSGAKATFFKHKHQNDQSYPAVITTRSEDMISMTLPIGDYREDHITIFPKLGRGFYFVVSAHMGYSPDRREEVKRMGMKIPLGTAKLFKMTEVDL
jgi:tetratricopeptide (TPR) repeat protein